MNAALEHTRKQTGKVISRQSRSDEVLREFGAASSLDYGEGSPAESRKVVDSNTRNSQQEARLNRLLDRLPGNPKNQHLINLLHRHYDGNYPAMYSRSFKDFGINFASLVANRDEPINTDPRAKSSSIPEVAGREVRKENEALSAIVKKLPYNPSNQDLVNLLYEHYGRNYDKLFDNTEKDFGLSIKHLLKHRNDPVEQELLGQKTKGEVVKQQETKKSKENRVIPPESVDSKDVIPVAPVKDPAPAPKIKTEVAPRPASEQESSAATILTKNRVDPNVVVPPGTFEKAIAALGRQDNPYRWLEDRGFAPSSINLLRDSQGIPNTCAVRVSNMLRVLDPETMPKLLANAGGKKIYDAENNPHLIAVAQTSSVIEKAFGAPYYSGPITKNIPPELLGKKFIAVVKYDAESAKTRDCTGHVDLADFTLKKPETSSSGSLELASTEVVKGFDGYDPYKDVRGVTGRISFYLIEEGEGLAMN